MAIDSDLETASLRDRLEQAVARIEDIEIDHRTARQMRCTIKHLIVEVRQVVERLDALERWQQVWERPIGE